MMSRRQAVKLYLTRASWEWDNKKGPMRGGIYGPYLHFLFK